MPRDTKTLQFLAACLSLGSAAGGLTGKILTAFDTPGVIHASGNVIALLLFGLPVLLLLAVLLVGTITQRSSVIRLAGGMLAALAMSLTSALVWLHALTT